jgi:hypothetical protein
MKFTKSIIGVGLVSIILTSCAVTTPMAVTNNSIGSKVGVSTTICIGGAPGSARVQYHGIMLNQNFGIVEAAKNGKISKIGAIDVKTTNYIFFQKKEMIVAGE